MFPNSLILAAPHGLFIGSVGNLKKMNIRSVSSFVTFEEEKIDFRS